MKLSCDEGESFLCKFLCLLFLHMPFKQMRATKDYLLKIKISTVLLCSNFRTPISKGLKVSVGFFASMKNHEFIFNIFKYENI